MISGMENMTSQMAPAALPDGGIPPIYVQLEPDGLEFSKPVPVQIALDPAAGYTVGQEFTFASYGADGTYDVVGSGHAERDSLGNLVVKTDPGVGVTRFSGLACFPVLTGMGDVGLGLHLVGGQVINGWDMWRLNCGELFHINSEKKVHSGVRS